MWNASNEICTALVLETKLLERGWTLALCGVAKNERHWAGVGRLSPWLSIAVLETSPGNERVAFCDCVGVDVLVTSLSALLNMCQIEALMSIFQVLVALFVVGVGRRWLVAFWEE